MAASPSYRKSKYHTRSNSLPSRAHPLISEFDDHLCRLRASESTSLLLDVCGIAKDALFQTKECTHELQSIMRRKQGCEIELTREVGKYLTSRKVVKKAIHKTRKACMLREVEVVTLSILESLLSFIAGPKLRLKSSSWSFVSMLVHPKRVASEDAETDTNELEKVNAALQSLMSHKRSKSDYIMHVENMKNWLEESESSIHDLDEMLECLFRHLIKTIVSLLNIFNH
ncbi:hypothetical protein FCV25MIE_28518 [Fagus crenata]